MRKRSGQVHSRESSATLQLTVSLLYPGIRITVDNYREKEYTTLIERRNTVLVRRMKMFLYMIRTEGRR